MANYLVLSISARNLANYEVCKEHGLWGMSKNRGLAQRVQPGDRFVVWIGGKGFTAHGTIESQVFPPEGDATAPWHDGRSYPLRFRIRIDCEYEQPKLYKFHWPTNLCEELSLSTAALQQGTALLQEVQFQKILMDLEHLNAARREQEALVAEVAANSQTVVSIDSPISNGDAADRLSHGRVQFLLVQLGRAVGCNVWVAREDRGVVVDGQSLAGLTLGQMPSLGFDRRVQDIIEHIDVIWFDGSSIRAAFEIEHTTAVYSGLLRLLDLVILQPNIRFDLYIVAPEERRNKVARELHRPSFSQRLAVPLNQICKFISSERLGVEAQTAIRFTGYLRYDWVANRLPESLGEP